MVLGQSGEQQGRRNRLITVLSCPLFPQMSGRSFAELILIYRPRTFFFVTIAWDDISERERLFVFLCRSVG